MFKDVAEVMRKQVENALSEVEPTPEEWRLIRCYRQLKTQERDFIRCALEALSAPPAGNERP